MQECDRPHPHPSDSPQPNAFHHDLTLLSPPFLLSSISAYLSLDSVSLVPLSRSFSLCMREYVVCAFANVAGEREVD